MALLGKFGISGAVDKVLSSGDLDSPKAQAALEKLLDNKKEAMEKVIEVIQSGRKVYYSLALQLLGELLDNTTIEAVMDGFPEFGPEAQNDITAILNKNKNYDPHYLLPYLKEPLSLELSRDLIMAHRKEFTAANLLKAVARTKPDLWPVIFELVHDRTDEKAFPEAIALTKSKNDQLRELATDVIGEYNNPAAIDALQAMLRDNSKKVHLAALRGLTRQKASLPAQTLFQLMQQMDRDTSPLVKALLGYCRDPELVNYLNKAMFGKNTKLRPLALQSLGLIANTDNIREVFRALADKPEALHADVINALIDSAGDKIIEAVEVLIDDPDKKVRDVAMKAVEISDPHDPKIINIMCQYLDSNIPSKVKRSFIQKLGQAKDDNAVKPMLKVMRSEAELRVDILKALTEIGDQSALADVFEMLASDDADVQAAALTCLGRITPKKFAGQIREQLLGNIAHLKDKALPKLLSLIESLTAEHRLPETTAYKNALEQLRRDSSDEIELMPSPSFSPAEDDAFGVGTDSPFGVSDVDPFGGGASEVFGTGELALADDQGKQAEEAAQADLNFEPGQMFSNRYKLIKEIGRGGYGSVWLVEDTFIQEEMVMKFLHQTLISDEVAIERFVRELRLARKITHTNIIRLFDYLDFGNVAAISMEYFPGTPLSSIIHKEILEPARTVKLVHAIAQALQVAHEAEVVHRDMKPANILVDDKDVIKIVDFGIAAASKQAESRLTRTGTLVGTPTYISPEQIQGRPVDGRTDLYSLGIIMYEMLSGQPPYRAEDPMALVFMHVEGNARRLEEINPVVPKGLADVVHKCIAPEPDNRYQSMAELCQALSELDLS